MIILEITWGFFTLTHILTLIAGILIMIGLMAILKRLKSRTQDIILLILSTFGPIAIIANLLLWHSPLEYLPFHLCSLNAIILPFLVLTKNKTLGNLLILWCVGALMSIVLNSAQAGYDLFGVSFMIYYFPHLAEFFIPIAMVVLKKVELDPKYIVRTILITWASFTIIHFINVGINSYTVAHNITNYLGEPIRVNYFYTLGNTGNAFLDFLYSLMPYPYWYLLLLLPIIAVILVMFYLPIILNNKKPKAATSEQ